MPMTTRKSSFLELGALFLLWLGALWSAQLPGGYVLQVVCLAAMGLLVLISATFRPGSSRDIGFRLDNLASSLLGVTMWLLPSLIVFWIVIHQLGYSFHPITGNRVFNTIFRGIFQELFFLGFLLPRWQDVFKNPVGAVVANALSFAFVHMPNLPFVSLTAIGGLIFGLLFLQHRNLIAIGLVHGILSLVIASTFYQENVLTTMKVGPPQLREFGDIIRREWKPGERIGMASHQIVPEQLGSLPDLIEKVSGRFENDNAAQNELLVTDFFNSPMRVYGIISAQDLERYVTPNLREKLHILGSASIWKRKVSFSGGFREMVYLVSNRPSATIEL